MTKKDAEKEKAAGPDRTLLVLVVDRSGSMASIREDMEGGITTLVTQQSALGGTCLVTVAQFDSEYELVRNAVPAAEFCDYRLVSRGGDRPARRHRSDDR